MISPRLVFGDDNEGDTKGHISNVTQKVVEIWQSPERKGALEVEVADVHVASLLGRVLILENKLESRDGVGDPHHDHQPDVHVVALEHGPGLVQCPVIDWVGGEFWHKCGAVLLSSTIHSVLSVDALSFNNINSIFYQRFSDSVSFFDAWKIFGSVEEWTKENCTNTEADHQECGKCSQRFSQQIVLYLMNCETTMIQSISSTILIIIYLNPFSRKATWVSKSLSAGSIPDSP